MKHWLRSTGEVILFGLPGLILRFINPDLLDGTGYETIEEFAASPAFYPAMQSSLAKFKKEYPHVRVVLVNRDGTDSGRKPMKIVGVGCGPGMLTEQAIREISRASLIYGSDRAIDLAKSIYPLMAAP